MYFPHSLGIFYQALTQYLGFPHYGDEYKVMGLAPYGKPAYLGEMRRIVRLRRTAHSNSISPISGITEEMPYQWETAAPEFGDLFSPALEELLGPRRRPEDPLEDRHRDIARSVQAMYEEAFFHLIGPLQQRFGLTDHRARGRLRDEFCRQRQGTTQDAVPARLCAVRCRGCRRRDWCGLCRLASARWRTVLRHGPRVLGPAIRPRRDCGAARCAKGREIAEAGCAVEEIQTRRTLPAHGG